MPTEDMALLLTLEAYYCILRKDMVDTYIGRLGFLDLMVRDAELVTMAIGLRLTIMDCAGEPWNRS